MGGPQTTDPAVPSDAELAGEASSAWAEHNDGHRSRLHRTSSRASNGNGSTDTDGASDDDASSNGRNGQRAANGGATASPSSSTFSAQSYLRYQGDKVRLHISLIEAEANADYLQFTSRFDANCYIHITRKCDRHDISRPTTFTDTDCLSARLPRHDVEDDEGATNALAHALSLLPPTLVIGIESDGLFTTTEQKEIAAHIPDAELVVIPSPDGHDGFLLEFEAINGWVDGWLRRKMPLYFDRPRVISVEEYKSGQEGQDGWAVQKESVFGEAEADITRW